MKEKKPLTLKQARRNLIKSGLFAGAAVIALIVVSLAWYTSGGLVGVDPIGAGVQSGDYFISNFYYWNDIDKDNIFDTGESWVPVAGGNMNTGAMVPNQKLFYKIEIQTSYSNLKLDFKSIAVSGIPEGGSMTTMQEYLNQLTVKFAARDKDAVLITGSTDISKTMLELLGESVPIPDLTVFSLGISAYRNQKVTIYYTLEMPSTLDQTMLASGFLINIGNIEVAGF